MIAEHVLEGIALTFIAASILFSLGTIILISACIRPLTTNIPILLTCNTYITLIGSSLMTLVVMIYGLLDTRDPSVTFNGLSCQVRSYVNYVFICAFFYSCALHAIFRFFRVVFPRHKILQTRAVFIVAISIQWLLAILYIAVYLVMGDFQYHSDIGSCWLSFKNIPALGTALVFVYATPLTVMILIYSCIIRYIRRTVQTQQIRQQANKRDLSVVKRMIVLVLISMAIGIPTGVMLLMYIIGNYLYPWAYHIQALTLTLGLVVESVVLGLITPQVREIFKKNRQRINPATVEQGTVERRVEPLDSTV